MTTYDAAFYMPPLRHGSGGHRTVLRYAQGLAGRGARVACVIEATDDDLEHTANEIWPVPDVTLVNGFDNEIESQVCYATAWHTAAVVETVPRTETRGYVIQDLEQWFHAVGVHHLDAATSLDRRLVHVTLGRWLTEHLASVYASRPHPLEFGVDRSRYRPSVQRSGAGPTPRVCVLYQPSKPRRFAHVLLQVAKRIANELPGTLVYLFGSDEAPPDGPWVSLGTLEESELSALYHECSVGVTASLTNPSRIPFEMMSAGLPVVDIFGANTVYDLPDSGCRLAVPAEASIFSAVRELVTNDALRTTLSEAAQMFMEDRDLAAEVRSFVEAHERLVEGLPADTVPFGKRYTALPAVADEDQSWAPSYVERELTRYGANR